MCAAVRACSTASFTLATLRTQTEDTLELLYPLMDDVMWDAWAEEQGVIPDGPAGESPLWWNILSYVSTPGFAEDLQRFQALMDDLLSTSARR